MPGMSVRQNVISKAKRIVVKVGTNSICDESGHPDRRSITNLAKQISQVMQSGVSVTLVASGAIGAGLNELGLLKRPKDMPELQAVAAVGQGQLMRTFHDIFARYGVHVAQVLVTRDDFEDRTRYLNIRNTLRSLADFNALPIINENDTVAIDEIRFGENDILAAIVANLLEADLLVLLTVVDGVLKDGKVIDVIEEVNEDAMSLVQTSKSKLGSGGMGTKLEAAKRVTKAGDVTVIANARTPRILQRLLAGEELGTVFIPAQKRMSSRRRWIGLTARALGTVEIDEGAARALTLRGKSLLPSGIKSVQGRFAKGAMVSIVGPQGEIARGLTNYNSQQLQKIMGLRTSQIAKTLGDKPYDVAIHRDNMTLV